MIKPLFVTYFFLFFRLLNIEIHLLRLTKRLTTLLFSVLFNSVAC